METPEGIMGRRLELIEGEALRHEAMGMADPERRSEHQEVAEALRWALRRLREEEDHADR